MTAPGPADPPATRLIAALRRAEAYPHPVDLPVRVVETHVSWVLLTGQYAYKIKKPVRFDFLDYSTLPRRRAACEEELRLNHRHAPGLYLAVSPVGGSIAQPRIDGDGTAIEYAVRMRQFAAEDELSALLDADRVAVADLERFGERLAHMHAAAQPAPAESDFGDPAGLRRVMRDNVAELQRLPIGAEQERTLRVLGDRLGALHDARDPLLQQRRADGWIRECHGDLHCGNVVRWQGDLTAFDGIEFDPALRFVDVASDLAFLTMDLAERGRADLRLAVLQSWVETLGDWLGLRLLPLYEANRALVRAKVAALRAAQEAGTDRARADPTAGCGHYLDWAARRIEPRRRRLLITCGLSGSGKTWLARGLRAPLGALHVRSDVERKRLAGLAAGADSRSPPDAGIYTQEFNLRTYARLHECAAAALAADESIIVDAAFLRRDERARFIELADAMSAPMVILHCSAPGPLLRDRVSARMAARDDASEAGLDVLQRQPGWWEAFDGPERAMVVEVDGSAPDPLGAARSALRARIG